MPLNILQTDLHILNMFTRMPFRYGIATLTALPHLFLRINIHMDGQTQSGIAAEGLAPKWFTKDPDSPVEREIDDMLTVIRAACDHAKSITDATTVFDLWHKLYKTQEKWAANTPHPPLLWNLGVSLIERALIDAFCKTKQITFAQAIHSNALAINLSQIHPSLTGKTPADLLPPVPSQSIRVRHTVGLSDPLTDTDIPTDERLTDGLPQSLQSCIDHYGLSHFKIKLPADPPAAIDRLRNIATIIQSKNKPFKFTIDGNEFFHDVQAFRDLWHTLLTDPDTRTFLKQGLLFVEQPLHRDVALSDEVADAFQSWPDRPAMIIDESDGDLTALPRAMAAGYVGTSHKNCKGIIKGIASACLIEHLRCENPDANYILSGEDLANVGPVALLQDLAVVATLGLSHVERNGHHYFAGLSAFPNKLQAAIIDHHGDLYHWHSANDHRFPALAINAGQINLTTINNAPFGCALDLDTHLNPAQFTPLEAWQPASLTLKSNQ